MQIRQWKNWEDSIAKDNYNTEEGIYPSNLQFKMLIWSFLLTRGGMCSAYDFSRKEK